MKITKVLPALLLLTCLAGAQDPPRVKTPTGPVMTQRFIMRTGPGDLGKWWKDSETASKLQLGNDQIMRLDQIFLTIA